MIEPQVEADLRQNTLVMSAYLLEDLSNSYKGYILTEDLLRDFVSRDWGTPKRFFECITFLYTIGYIEEKNYKIRITEEAKNGFIKESSITDFVD